jgi:hypothetical protein
MDVPSLRHLPDEPWMSRHGWRVGIALVALVGGGYFWQRRRRRRQIAVDRISQQWLAQREFSAGQHPDD